MIVRNIVAKGYLFLIFLAWGNIMSRRHIWLTNERYIKFFWMKKIYFQIVMIFLESQHDVIYEKLNYIKIVKLFVGWERPFFGWTILKLNLFTKRYKILFSGITFEILVQMKQMRALWIQGNISHCSKVWKQSISYFLH